MLNQKRSRSKSKSKENETIKKSKVEEAIEKTDDYLIQKVYMYDISSKLNCKICSKDISKNIKILCALCPDFIYCINCLISDEPHEQKKNSKHDYHIIDRLNFQVFTSDWNASEELHLLIAIEKFGLDNWTDISEYLGTKSKLQCEAHYYNFYYKNNSDKFPEAKDVIIQKESKNNIERGIIENLQKENNEKDLKKIEEIIKSQGKVPELSANKDNKNNRSRSLAKNRNKKDQTTINSASEILGYWPKREEFDIEFLNDAELEIAELEFLDDDSEKDRNLKLNVLKVYNAQLEEREKRKKFVISRGLLDVKKQMNFERRLSKEDREIYSCIKPFARFLEESQFNDLFEGFVLEKNLRQRLNQLKHYKSLGMKNYDDIEKYLESEMRNKKEEKKNNINSEFEPLGSKLTKYYSKHSNNILLENELERSLIQAFSLRKNDIEDVKKDLFKELMSETGIPEKIDKIRNIIKDSNIPKDKIDQVVDYIVKLKMN